MRNTRKTVRLLPINHPVTYRIVAFTLAFTVCFSVSAQDQNGEQDQPEPQVKVEKKERSQNFVKGLKGIDSLSITRVWAASLLVPGYAQAYNKQYWKLPVIYGTAAGFIYGGAHSHSLYKQTGQDKYLSQMRLYYAGAALTYLGSVIDGVASYKTSKRTLPAKATIFSTMLPGLGQAYNGDYWKIPVIYGGFAFMGYWYDLNQMQYQRFKRAYNEEYAYSQGTSDTPSEFHGRLSLDGLKNYRNSYRRDRDFAVLYTALWYGLNIIDALVFAQLSDFDVSDNLSFNVSPVIMTEPMRYAGGSPAVGLTMRVGF